MAADMIRALPCPIPTIRLNRDVWRKVAVLGSALALICAGQPLPLL